MKYCLGDGISIPALRIGLPFMAEAETSAQEIFVATAMVSFILPGKQNQKPGWELPAPGKKHSFIKVVTVMATWLNSIPIVIAFGEPISEETKLSFPGLCACYRMERPFMLPG